MKWKHRLTQRSKRDVKEIEKSDCSRKQVILSRLHFKCVSRTLCNTFKYYFHNGFATSIHTSTKTSWLWQGAIYEFFLCSYTLKTEAILHWSVPTQWMSVTAQLIDCFRCSAGFSNWTVAETWSCRPPISSLFLDGQPTPVVAWEASLYPDDPAAGCSTVSLTWAEYQSSLKQRCWHKNIIPKPESGCSAIHHDEWSKLALFDFLLQVTSFGESIFALYLHSFAHIYKKKKPKNKDVEKCRWASFCLGSLLQSDSC